MKKLIYIISFLSIGLLYSQDNSSWVKVYPTSETGNPNNTFETGRGECLAVDSRLTHENKIYLGSKGGTWMSWDTGETWNRMDPNNFMHFGGASDMLVSPSTGNVLVASSDLGVHSEDPMISYGIYKFIPTSSTSGTWSLLSNNLPTKDKINKLQFYPGNENIIYACTNGGLYRSDNGGVSWVIADATPTYNIVFLKNGTTVYSYATGARKNTYKESVDTGVPNNTFTNLPIVTTLYGAHLDVTANLCTGNVSGTVKEIFIFASEYDAPSRYELFKFTLDVNTNTRACSSLKTQNDGANHWDRMALGYSGNANGKLYYGGLEMWGWNTITNAAFIVSYTHSDQHDLKYIPALNKMVGVCDGGFAVCDFNVSSTDFERENVGLNICQINSFSGATVNTNRYITGEQDMNPGGRLIDIGSVSDPGFWTESNSVIIDKFNDSFFIGKASGYEVTYKYSNSSSTNTFTDSRYWNYYPVAGSSLLADLANPHVSEDWPLFYYNELFQDPAREKIYYGTRFLSQWDFVTKAFVIKFEPYNTFTDCTNPVRCCGWPSIVNGIAISPNDKNAFYLTTSGAPASQVVKYVGANIDDSWYGHNDGLSNWQLITPDINTIVTSTALSNSEIAQFTYNSIVVNPWNKNQVWVTCSPIPRNPQIKVLFYDGSTWSNYSTGIPQDEGMRSMVIDYRTNNGIYVGTSRAVYFRDASLSSWQPFINNFPRNIVRQMEINYTENTLRVGTYGMGIWKSNLYCPGTLAEITYSASKEFKEGSPSVVSRGTITANGSDMVYYRGTDYVELLPGFNTATNSNFLAYIHECNASGNSPGMNMKIKNPNPEPEVVNEIAEPTGINIYPNPNQGIFSVNISSESTNDVTIYDFLGRLVFSKNQLQGEIEINLKGQPAGIYIVKATNNANGKIEVKKIILESSQY